jgi:hypothetical protein
MKFKKFLNYLLRVPFQIIKMGRGIVYRLPSWNPWLEVLRRGVEVLHSLRTPAARPPMRC